MRRLGALAVGVALLCWGCGMWQVTTQRKEDVGLSASNLLPVNGDVTNWQRAGEVRVFAGKKLYDYIDGAGEVFMKYDFKEVATTEYENPATGDLMAIDIYDMGSATEAFGIYSYSRYVGAEFVNVGNEGFVTDSSLDFWEDRFYVKVQAFQMGDDTSTAMRGFATRIAGGIPDGAWVSPAVLGLLPSEGKVLGSEKYFHEKLILDNLVFISEENTFALSGETDCAWAEYETDGKRAKVLFVAYPTEAEAKGVAAQLAEGRHMPDGKSSGVWAMSGVKVGKEQGMLLRFRKVVGVVLGGDRDFRDRATLFFVGQISRAGQGEIPGLPDVLGL